MKGTTTKKRSKQKGVIVQTLAAMPVLTLLLALLCAKLMLSGSIPERFITVVAAAIAGIIAFVIAIYPAIRMKEKRAVWGIMSACTYAALLLFGNLLFFGVGYGNVAPVILTVLVAGIAGSVLGAGRKKRRKYA